MNRPWTERPAVYRKVIFTAISIIVALVLLGVRRSYVPLEQSYIVGAVYAAGAAIVFILGLLPWVWLERD